MRKMFSEASTELCKCTSNSDALCKCFLCNKVAVKEETGDSRNRIPWEREGDQIILTAHEASDFAANKPFNKCIVLQTFARVYNPLEYSTPIALVAKLLFQDLWKRKHAWYDALQQEQTSWSSWPTELSSMNACGIVRAKVKRKFIADRAPWWGGWWGRSSDWQNMHSHVHLGAAVSTPRPSLMFAVKS